MKPLLINEIKNVLHVELKTPLIKGLITGVSIDSRTTQPGDVFIALRGQRFDGHDFIAQAVQAGARALIIDRNLPISDALKGDDLCVMKVENTLAALGKLAQFYRRSLGHGVLVIAVTGSNGKTTTREMIYHTLSKFKKGHRSPHNYNNAVGVPLTLLGIEHEHDFAVVEIATNAPGEIAALSRITEPDVAVITTAGPAHLAGLQDLDGVITEKISIVAGLKERGVVICPAEPGQILERLRPLGQHIITTGLDANTDISATQICRLAGKTTFQTNDRCQIALPLAGLHNVSNALVALAAVRRMGLTSHDFAEAMLDFNGVEHRMTLHEVHGITIIDDSYNANPASTRAALEELNRYAEAARRVFICGDMNELGPEGPGYHRELGNRIARSEVDLLLAVGPQAALTATAAIDAGMGPGSVQRSINSKRLARLVKSLIRQGDVILVKGSRGMEMEKVVDSLKRFRGPRVEQQRPIKTAPSSPTKPRRRRQMVR